MLGIGSFDKVPKSNYTVSKISGTRVFEYRIPAKTDYPVPIFRSLTALVYINLRSKYSQNIKIFLWVPFLHADIQTYHSVADRKHHSIITMTLRLTGKLKNTYILTVMLQVYSRKEQIPQKYRY